MVERQLIGPGGATEVTLAQIRGLLNGTLTISDSAEREYTPVTTTVTSSGTTILYTPQTGKRIRLVWMYAQNSPTATSYPILNIAIGAKTIYRVWNISKRQVFTGLVNESLTINLSANGQVLVSALVEEF